MLKTCLAALLVLAGCGSSSPKARSGPRFLTDATGRALILRGINVDGNAKSTPRHAITVGDDELQLMARRMGFNFVRYLVFWDGLEPQPGVYDEAYIDQIAADVQRLASYGLWVMLDVHQDVYAARFCCDGAPEWAIRDDGLPFTLQTSTWSFNYFQPAVQRAFDNFWDGDAGKDSDLQAHYVAMLRHLAARFRDVPNVLGYDVMNEPFPGTAFDIPEALGRSESDTSPEFDRTLFAAFYQRAIDAIREADGDKYVFFEPRYGAPGNGSPSWIPPLVDPRPGESHIAYAPHLYSVQREASGIYAADDPTVADWEQQRTEELSRQGMPLLMGEWGLAFGDQGSERFVEDVVAMSERMLLSWAYWSWASSGPDGWALYDRDAKALNPIFELMDRPYPRATAGEPVSLQYDAATSTLHYTWRETGIAGETEVFVPAARDRTDAVTVALSDPDGAWSSIWDADVPGLLRLKADVGQREHTLTITPVTR